MTITSPQHYFLYWSDDIFILNQGSVNLGLLVEIPQCDGSLSTSGICGEQMKSSVSCTGILIKVCVIQVLSYTAERFITSWPWAMAKHYLWTVVLLQHDLNLIILWSVKILLSLQIEFASWSSFLWDEFLACGNTGPCITNVFATRRKNFSQWYCSFQRKLLSHWLKFLRHVAITLVIQGPGTLWYLS